MKHKVKLLLPLIAIAGLLSCRQQTGLSFKNPDYVPRESIDFSVEPSSSNIVDFGIDGIQYFKVIGPYIVVLSPANTGFFTVLDKRPPYSALGSFFLKGRGPGELPALSIPSNSGQNENGDVFADLNNLTGKIIRWNISQSLKDGRTVIEEIGETGNHTLSILNLGEDGIFYKELDDDKDCQLRYIQKNGNSRFIPDNMRVLNDAVLANKKDDGTRFNILSTVALYDSSSKRLMEASSGLNTIHLYSVSGKFAKTFCIGDRIYDYNELADRNYSDRPITTFDGKNIGKFAGFLYFDVPMADFLKPESIPMLLLVPWNGSGVIQVQLPDKITSFDIDPENSVLFGYNAITEVMKVYDISQILKKLRF